MPTESEWSWTARTDACKGRLATLLSVLLFYW